jgi:hypothetical protein
VAYFLKYGAALRFVCHFLLRRQHNGILLFANASINISLLEEKGNRFWREIFKNSSEIDMLMVATNIIGALHLCFSDYEKTGRNPAWKESIRQKSSFRGQV